jgi:phospholipid/cholesterol/gamma-HCH transport system substrate-binding protein
MSRVQLSLVGTFVVAGVLLFAVGIFMIGDRRLLFTQHFEVNTDLGNVTGVQEGTRVRVGGVDAGEVLSIGIPASPVDRFEVGMRVRDDLHALVRIDSVAAVLTDGLLGNVFIQIRAGSSEAALVDDGGTLRGIDAVEVSDLIAEGRNTFRVLTTEFSELRENFGRTIDLLGDTVQGTTLLLDDVGNDVRAISTMTALFMNEARGIAAGGHELIENALNGQGTLGKLLTDDELYAHATGIAAEMESTLQAARGATEQIESILLDFNGSGGSRDEVWNDLQRVLGTAQNAMSDLAENTEALKRNWLFSGFFNRRGFFNLDAMTLAEYRELSSRDTYTTLQIWLQADQLFTLNQDGSEVLSESGRKRLNSAMVEFLDYPRDSPLVVEGYATQGARDEQYLRADERATGVRDYLVNVFGRVATLTATMPVVAEAIGSPSGDGRWDGVALTIFVRPDSLVASDTVGEKP